MIRTLKQCWERQQAVEMIYLSKNGKTSKRIVRILEMDAERIKAYCYTRHSYRVFTIANILAVVPVSGLTAG